MIYDINGTGSVGFLIDGQLIWRYLTGYRGAALISGISVDPAAKRKTAPEIEGYLNTIWWTLDADGDGKASYGDGLMIFRHTVGFTGDSLIRGAVAAGATRSTATEIRNYLLKMTT